jgi:hypothetical protein
MRLVARRADCAVDTHPRTSSTNAQRGEVALFAVLKSNPRATALSWDDNC